jgi:hypothetical protein
LGIKRAEEPFVQYRRECRDEEFEVRDLAEWQNLVAAKPASD